MEYLAMCDFSIASRVCCMAVGQNSLCSIVLGVILKCYFSGCSCCYKCLLGQLGWKQRGASRTPPDHCLHPCKSKPHLIPGVRSLLHDFSSSCATIALTQQAARVAGKEQLVATLLQPRFLWEDLCPDTLPQVSWVAPYGGPLNCNLCSSCSFNSNAWSKLGTCSSPEWHLKGSTEGLCCVLGSVTISVVDGELAPFVLEGRLGRMVS